MRPLLLCMICALSSVSALWAQTDESPRISLDSPFADYAPTDEFEKADLDLNITYSVLMGALPQISREQLKTAQLAWLKYRDSCSRLEEQFHWPAPNDPPNCYKLGEPSSKPELTRERVLRLRKMLTKVECIENIPFEILDFEITEDNKKTETLPDGGTVKTWDSVLHFKGSSARLLIGSNRSEISNDGTCLSTGYEELATSSVAIRGLFPGGILWSRWTSLSEGHGLYTDATAALYRVKGTELTPLLQQDYAAFGKGGPCNFCECEIRYEFDHASKQVVSHMTLENSYPCAEEDLFVRKGYGGDMCTSQVFTMELERCYTFADNKPVLGEHRCYLDVGEKEAKVDDLATFVTALQESHRGGAVGKTPVSPAVRADIFAQLKTLNPNFGATEVWNGRVRLPDSFERLVLNVLHSEEGNQ